MFFFGGQQYRVINRFTNPSRQTLPTTAELAGNFALRLRGADNIVGTADDGVLRDPTTGQPFQGNVIPSNRITTDGRAIANVYSKMIGIASEYTDTPTANNSTFQIYNPFEQRQDIIRVDWQINNAQRMHGRYLHDEYDLLDPYGVFSGAPLPTVPTNRSRPGTSYQIGHTWVVRNNLINEARISAAWNGQRINPQGDTWQRSTYGFQFTELFPGGFINDGIPDGARQRIPEPDRTVVRAALADDRHHVPGHADLHAEPALVPHRLRDHAQPQGPERPRRVPRRRHLQRVGKSQQHQQRAG